MTTNRRRLACTIVTMLAAVPLAAQDKPAEPPTSAAAIVPLRVQVVISRYENEKKVSSLPYQLSINAGQKGSLRMGTKVPVASTSYTPIATGGAGVNPLTSYQYQDVGTNIDCTTGALDAGRFRVELSIEDSSVYPDSEARPNAVPIERPSFRSFRVNNSLVLKDGQTAQFTTAVDKITGIVTKVDVTLTIVK
jgi:hypothetical protein